MTVRHEIGEFRGNQILFRLAQARCVAAERRADQHRQTGDNERRMREFDCVVETIVLVQAALEAHINQLFIDRGEDPPGRGWIARWKAIGSTTRDETDIKLRPTDVDFLEQLSAWRNALLHGDRRSRDRLRELLHHTHPDLERNHEPALLTADYARSVLIRAESLFRWAQAHTGVDAPFTKAAWVAPDEVS